MCGEYAAFLACQAVSQELTPRTRRIHQIFQDRGMIPGTTSACAENTTRLVRNPKTFGNYLRVRGEYIFRATSITAFAELPPRARRILPTAPQGAQNFGTTSACAENTNTWLQNRHKNWNYLRVRGEYSNLASSTVTCVELPPRARRIPHRGFTR